MNHLKIEPHGLDPERVFETEEDNSNRNQVATVINELIDTVIDDNISKNIKYYQNLLEKVRRRNIETHKSISLNPVIYSIQNKNPRELTNCQDNLNKIRQKHLQKHSKTSLNPGKGYSPDISFQTIDNKSYPEINHKMVRNILVGGLSVAGGVVIIFACIFGPVWLSIVAGIIGIASGIFISNKLKN